MDNDRYTQSQEQKYLDREALCRRCGACCGVLEGDPCEHLKKGLDDRYFCGIYGERFGLRKTVKGEPILCVPIRNMLHKTWWGRSQCAYLKRILCFMALLCSLTSCSVTTHLPEISILSGVGKGRKDIERYVDKQIQGFEALKKAIKTGRLKPGISKTSVCRKYGDPILSKNLENDRSAKESLLYRRPKDYFSEDRVYLYFDKDERLVRWE